MCTVPGATRPVYPWYVARKNVMLPGAFGSVHELIPVKCACAAKSKVVNKRDVHTSFLNHAAKIMFVCIV